VRARYLDLPSGGSFPEGWDGLRIGSETCASLLPRPDQLPGLFEGIDPSRLTLVTPLADPREVGFVLECVEAARSGGWGEIVVNDWGVLSETGRRTSGGLTAGRLLMRFRRGPGETDPWENLDEPSRRYFAWGPLFDTPFLKFLKDWGVSRVEADPPRHWIPLPSSTILAVSFHRDTRMISVSGSCPWLRPGEEWDDRDGCGGECVRSGDLLMHAPALSRPLAMRGKAVIERLDDPPPTDDQPSTVDRLIFDGAKWIQGRKSWKSE
jgi:hypothetical protein